MASETSEQTDTTLSAPDYNVTTRFHHVSFTLTLGIGIDADIKAVTLK